MSRVKSFQWNTGKNSIEISASVALYPREPLYAAGCVFIDRYYVGLDMSRDMQKYTISLVPKNGSVRASDAGRIAGEFKNELLSNVLRYSIASRNQKIREMVVRSALFFSQPRKTQEKTARVSASREKNA